MSVAAASAAAARSARRNLLVSARTLDVDRVLLGRSHALLDRALRTLAAPAPAPDSRAAQAPAPGVTRSVPRCARRGRPAAAEYQVLFLARYAEHESVLENFSIRVCGAHRLGLLEALRDGPADDALRHELQARRGSPLALRSVRVIFAALE